jgi:hypothetical protein
MRFKRLYSGDRSAGKKSNKKRLGDIKKLLKLVLILASLF